MPSSSPSSDEDDGGAEGEESGRRDADGGGGGEVGCGEVGEVGGGGGGEGLSTVGFFSTVMPSCSEAASAEKSALLSVSVTLIIVGCIGGGQGVTMLAMMGDQPLGGPCVKVRHFGSKTAKVRLVTTWSKSAKVGHPAQQ